MTISLSPLDTTSYKSTTIVTLSTIILAIWIALGQAPSLYMKKWLNYLELFFHSNLAILSIFSAYFTRENKTRQRQALGVVTVGAAFIAFCGIILYQACQVISKYKTVRNIISTLRKITKKESTAQSAQDNDNTAASSITHSTVEMKECLTVSSELREPLLA